MKIILGSGSRARKRILDRAGYVFDILTADIDEKAIRHNDPKELVLAIANAKADAILPKITEPAILITADQVVFCDGAIREKPESEAQAREYLRSYGSYPAETINGVTVTNTLTGKRYVKLDVSTVYFKAIPESVIDKLVEEKNIFSQAGSFSAEDPSLAPYVERIEGSLDSVEGLSTELLREMLEEVGD